MVLFELISHSVKMEIPRPCVSIEVNSLDVKNNERNGIITID